MKGLYDTDVIAHAAEDPYFSVWESAPKKDNTLTYYNLKSDYIVFSKDKSIKKEYLNGDKENFEISDKQSFLVAIKKALEINNKDHSSQESANELIPYLMVPPFMGGAMGFISYDAARRFERLTGFKTQKDIPECFFVVPQIVLAIDHSNDNTWVFSPAKFEKEDIKTFLTSFLSKLSPNKQTKKEYIKNDLSKLNWKLDKSQFTSIVEKAKEYIRAGDIFQVVLSNKLSISQTLNSNLLFDELKNHNPTAFHFLQCFGDRTLVGASPELMLRSTPQQNSITMRLVAGTYPKDVGTDKFKKPVETLLGDEKEKAEHIMLVDHCRNDIGRVAEIGSVVVSDMFAVEELKNVYHLVSQVDGILSSENSIFEAIQSCAPISTLTGTPKIRAMDIISELEPFPRGVFGGFAGIIGVDGYLDSAVIIRSVVASKDTVEIFAGAGIVDDSIAEREFEECFWKAQTIVDLVISQRDKQS